jgi:two-component system NarL family response regulator
VVRTVVRSILQAAEFRVVADESDARGAETSALRERPDVCLLDIDMPGDGIKACRRITNALPEVKVVMLTGSADDAMILDAVTAGAAGYLKKDSDLRALPAALHDVLDGSAAISGGLARLLADAYRQQQQPRSISTADGKPVQLTDKEWAVLDGLREGLTTAQLAERLYVAPVTVRTHVSALLRKLRVPDRAAAIHLARGR